jgi:hypothetical protein
VTQRRGWLLREVPQTGLISQMLYDILLHPQAPALLAADPTLARMLRSLLWVLGHRTPPGVFPPHRRTRRKPPDFAPIHPGYASRCRWRFPVARPAATGGRPPSRNPLWRVRHSVSQMPCGPRSSGCGFRSVRQ